MKFTTFLLALPAMALAKPVADSTPTPTSAAASATATTDIAAVCTAQAGPYASYCPRCEGLCASRTGDSLAQCLWSVFSQINEYESNCEARGGWSCEDKGVDSVCGAA